MLFHVRMDVHLPHDLPATEAAEIIAREKAYAQGLQANGKWRHIWRLAGQYANVSIFDVRDNAELHELLSGLPLFKFMRIEVTPMLRHPSSIRDDDS
jgi:muconolactone D-isomerase